MKQKISFFIAVTLVFCSLFIFQSCKKDTNLNIDSLYLSVNFPNLSLKHDLYYQINNTDRLIEMEFSQQINPETVSKNISFFDKDGSLESYYDFVISGKKVLITFHSDFELNHGWKYFLMIKAGLKSISGESVKQNEIFEFRTSNTLHLCGVMERNSIACISDIHMGDTRAVSDNYCWFGKNANALENFLNFVIDSNEVRQLVILGDLFDEWLVPYSISPFDSLIGVNNSKEYFESISNSTTNKPVFDKFRAIASNQEIDLIYTPGNHDMLITKEILEEIIPNIIWKSDVAGLGKYSPVDGVIMEHGHRYDFFNCPQPLVNSGHVLPPGYFISRLYAQGMMDQASGPLKGGMETTGSFEFLAAWEVAYFYSILHFLMPLPHPDSSNVLMGGIDNYNEAFSFNGARDMYAENIEDFWPATQTTNKVAVPTECCFHAIWNGHSDLYSAATTEYMKKPPAPNTYKIVAFGHTHEPMLKVYKEEKEHISIYANSGSWIDADQSDYKVRTYLIIQPAEWTGSDLDVVSLYQYNLDSDGGSQGSVYKPHLISQESISR